MTTASWPSTHESQIPPLDADGWGTFVKRYRCHMVRYCCRLGLPREAAEDIAQTVLMKLVKIMPEFRYNPRKSLRAYLKTIIRNAVFDVFQAERRWKDAIDEVTRSLTEQRAVDLADEFSDEWRRDILKQALQRVQVRIRSERNFQAFLLRTIEGLPAKDVAKKLGMNVDAVHQASSRGKRYLDDVVCELIGQGD